MNGVYIKKLNKISFNVVKIEQIPTIWIKVEKNTFKYGRSGFCTFASVVLKVIYMLKQNNSIKPLTADILYYHPRFRHPVPYSGKEREEFFS